MTLRTLLAFAALATLTTACAPGAQEGEECTEDADCADGLECHLHEGEDDHGECEAHDEDDHDEDDHDE